MPNLLPTQDPLYKNKYLRDLILEPNDLLAFVELPLDVYVKHLGRRR